MQELRNVRAAERGADEDTPLVVDDDSRDPGSATSVEAAASRAGRLDVDRPRVDASIKRRGKGVTDGRHLRLGEDDAWRKGARGLWLDLNVPPEDALGGDASLVLAHVRQEGATVRIADRVEPLVPRNPHRGVNVDVAPGLQADRLQSEVACCWAAPYGDEQLVGLELFARLEPHRDTALAAGDRSRGRAD